MSRLERMIKIDAVHMDPWGPFSVVVTLDHDTTLTPEFFGEEMFTKEALNTFESGDWAYVTVTATVKYMNLLSLGSASMGGVEYGYMGEQIGWCDPLSDANSYPVDDVVTQAIDEAKSNLHTLLTSIAQFG